MSPTSRISIVEALTSQLADLLAAQIADLREYAQATADSAGTIQLERNLRALEVRRAELYRLFEEAAFTSPPVVASKAAREQACMLIEAKTTILNSGDFLPAGEVAKLAGLSSSNPGVQPSEWKHNRDIFAIQQGGSDLFPVYALNSDNHRPRKQMAEILQAFGSTKDGWGLAFWFAALNSFLDDERPQDVLAVDPDRVIAAAKDEVAGLQHG